MKKILIISDTHYPKASIDPIIYKLISLSDIVIHCGDIEESEFLEELKYLGKTIYAVKGNNYDYILSYELPDKLIIQIEGTVIGVTHGNGPSSKAIDNASKVFSKDKVDIICYGHSHVMDIRKEGKTLYINPGSFSKSRTRQNSCVVLEIENKNYTYKVIHI